MLAVSAVTQLLAVLAVAQMLAVLPEMSVFAEDAAVPKVPAVPEAPVLAKETSVLAVLAVAQMSAVLAPAVPELQPVPATPAPAPNPRSAFQRRVFPSTPQRVGPFPLMQIASMEICEPCPEAPVLAKETPVPAVAQMSAPPPTKEMQPAKAFRKAPSHSPAAWSV